MGFVTAAASLLANTATPLTVAQGEQLLNVLADASGSYQRGGPVDPATINWPAALEQLKPLLAPAQYDSVKANSRGLQVMGLIKQYYSQRNAAAAK
jgi:hypothetical protein